MIYFRTYLSTLDHWHTWRVGDDPVHEVARMVAWARGMPYANPDGGFSILFDVIPKQSIFYDSERARDYAAAQLPWYLDDRSDS